MTDAGRVLREEYQSVLSNDRANVKSCLERIKKAEEDVVSLRRSLIRELAQVTPRLIRDPKAKPFGYIPPEGYPDVFNPTAQPNPTPPPAVDAATPVDPK